MKMRPLAGGYSGETFVVDDPSAPGGRAVVRLYRRHPERAAIDAALLDLVRGLLPVPRVLELRRPAASNSPPRADGADGTAPGMLVLELMTGVRLEDVLRDRPGDLDLGAVGRSLGETLRTLSGIPFARPGMFVDDRLAPDTTGLPADLRAWADELRAGSRLSTWPARDWDALVRLVDGAETLVDAADAPSSRRVVLVHSDFNPKNLLVNPATGAVTAVLDWEFAHAGSPFTDLGNLTRFEREPALVEPVLAAHGLVGAAGTDLLRLGRALDLWALLELAARPADAPVPRLASELLLAQARAGDLLAWPWAGPRVALPL